MLKSRFPAIAAELEPLARGALQAGAELVEARAKDRVAVGESDPHIRDDIHTESEPEGVYVVAGTTQTFYGHILEHGSVKMAPRPFLVPSLEESRKEILGLVVAALRHVE
jgi:HK97 gp10 family phage protein